MLVVRRFGQYSEASEYLYKIATDKFLLKILGNESYRMFAISPDNFSILKRLNNIDQYVDFFTENYFEDRYQGEKIVGKWGLLPMSLTMKNKRIIILFWLFLSRSQYETHCRSFAGSGSCIYIRKGIITGIWN